MANVLYVDNNALQTLAAGELLGSLLATGRQVIITSSVLNELQAAAPSVPSAATSLAWINLNINLGNVQRVDTYETGKGAGEQSIADQISVNPTNNSLAISEDRGGLNTIFSATNSVGSPAPVSTLSFLSQSTMNGQTSYSAAVSGINKIINDQRPGDNNVLFLPTNQAMPAPLNIFGPNAVGSTGSNVGGWQVSPFTYTNTDVSGTVLGTFEFPGNATGSVTYTAATTNPMPVDFGVTAGGVFGVCTAPGPLQGLIWTQATLGQNGIVAGEPVLPGITTLISPLLSLNGGYLNVPTVSFGGNSPQILCNASNNLFNSLVTPGQNGSLSIDNNGFNFVDGTGNTTNVSFGGNVNLTTSAGDHITASLMDILGARHDSNGNITFDLGPNSSGSLQSLLIDGSSGQVSFLNGATTVFSAPSGSSVSFYASENNSYSQLTATTVGGEISAYISGHGDVTHFSSTQITLAPDSSATIVGQNNIIGVNGNSGYGATIKSITIDGVTYSLADTSPSNSTNIPVTVASSGSGSGVTIANTDGTSSVVAQQTPSGTPTNDLLSVSVAEQVMPGAPGNTTGGDGSLLSATVANAVFVDFNATVAAAGQAGSDIASLSSSAIANAGYRPYYEQILGDFNNVPAALSLWSSGSGDTSLPFFASLPISYLSPNAIASNPTPSFTDPLLIDLTGDGVNVSNWVTSPVYFGTNVLADANGNPTTMPDGLKHETAWMEPGTAMLVFEASGTVSSITNITQTVSEYLNAGPTPGQYADGLAALAALTQTGATSFSAATAKIDPNTGVSYWNEVMVWSDANQNGVSDAGEIVSLSSLGITSISLQGSGNKGESIDGSAVTDRTTFTYSDGTTGQAAAVNFENDSIGQSLTSASGGVIINASLSEGSPTLASTFVAQNSTAHSYTIQNGTLTDNTTATTVASSGITAVLSTTQSDTITVNATDTGTYYLGGGTGSDVLYGGAGTNIFLVNPSTTVHGGTASTSFNVAKVVGTMGVTIDLASEHLQEVIGGGGDDVINASGTTWNVFIQAGSGNSIIIGGAGTAAINGGTGDDFIEAGPGGSVIHAGTGNDVIIGGSGNITQTQPSYVNAGASSNAAYVERLYNGLLGREPDQSSFTVNVANLANGAGTQASLASAIVDSPEGQVLYGSLDNTQFVNAIFQRLVGRAPSTTELNDFVSGLNAGEPQGDAVQAVASSAQSQAYWGEKHPGASDVIFAGAGNDIVKLGTNNSEVYAGTGTLTLIGNTTPGAVSILALHDSYADYDLTHNSDGTYTITDETGSSNDGPVTFSNIGYLSFKDVSQVAIGSAQGMPVPDKLDISNPAEVTVNGSGQYVIAAVTLLANDKDYQGLVLSVRELLDVNGNAIARGSSGAVNGGTAALSSDGSAITFTPASGFTGVMSFRYHVEDSSGTPGLEVFQGGTNNTAELAATVYLNTPAQPTDPLFDDEWFLQAANVVPVLNTYTGAGVKVGIFDVTGNVDFSNPDLAVNAGGSTKIDGTPGQDNIGTHATLVAGVIGAAVNGTGAVGVAPDATLYSVDLGPVGSSVYSAENFQNLMLWSNYDVVNNSFGVSPPFYNLYLSSAQTNLIDDAFQNAIQNGRGSKGTIIVVAGGNDRANGENTNDYPLSNSPYAITVGGINATSDLGTLHVSGKPFSNPGYSILISAPANDITSDGVTYTNDYGQVFGASSETAQGTSFAAPIVAGVVADMLQANPNLTWQDVQQILAYTAAKVDPNDTNPFVAGSAAGSGWVFNGATNWNGGGLHYSPDYGYGEVDAQAAVHLAQTWSSLGTGSNYYNIVGNFQSDPYYLSSGTFSATGTVSTTQYGVQHIQVIVNISNAVRNDLTITLTSPSGVTSTLMERPGSVIGQAADAAEYGSGEVNDFTPGEFDYTFETEADRGESFAGNWTIAITDASGAASSALITGVEISLQGNYTANQSHTFIYTDEFAQLSSTPGSSLYDPNNAARSTLVGTGTVGGVTYIDRLNLAATTGAVNLDLTSGSTNNSIDGRSLTISSGTVIGTLYLGDGPSTVHANNFGDTIYAGSSNSTLIGGTGTDTLNYALATSGVTVNLAVTSAQNTGGAGTDAISGIENLTGSNYDDVLTGDSNNNVINGGAGNDIIQGGAGNDTLIGGAGTDTLSYAAATAGVTVSLAITSAQSTGGAGTDTISGFENLTGSSFNDTLTGDSNNNVIDGGAGNDLIQGGAGNDILIGGDGTDTLNYASATAGVTVSLALTSAQNTGGAGTDTVSGFENLTGSAYNDTLEGDGGNNTLVGGGGTDTLSYASATAGVTVSLALTSAQNTGGAGTDTVSGFENLAGSAYNDVLTGTSDSVLIGNGGSDEYKFSSSTGSQTIVNGSPASSAPAGQFDAAATADKLWFSISGNDLVVQVLGTSNTTTIKDWYLKSSAELASIVSSDGASISTSGILSLADTMMRYQAQNASFNPATATSLPTDLNPSAGWTYSVTSSGGTYASAKSTLMFGSGISATVSGHDDIILMPNDGNSTVNLSGANQAVVAYGNTLNLTGSGSSVDLVGQNDQISLVSNSNESLTLDGTNFTVNSTGNTIFAHGVYQTGTINGNNNTIYEAYGVNIQINGTGNTIIPYGQGGFSLEDGGVTASYNLNYTNNSIDGDNDTVTLTGSNDSVYISGTNVHLTISGTNQGVTIDGLSDTVSVNSGIVSVSFWAAGYGTVIGNNNIINLDHESVVVNGTSNTLNVASAPDGYGFSNQATIAASSSTINIQAGVTATVTGNNDAFYIASMGNSNLTLSGTGDVIQSISNTIHLGTGSSATVQGNNNTISLTNSDSVTATGTGEVYQFASGGGHAEIGAASGANTGEVDLGAGLTEENLWFEQVGNNLQIDILGTNDHLTVDNWFGGSNTPTVQSIHTTDGLKIDNQVNQLVSSMAAYTAAHSGFNPTTATQMPSDATLQTSIAASWH